jgi:DNA-binding transcriptional LysR family regulator
MIELVDIKLLTAAITLARELNYTRASKRLNISRLELDRQITALESQLCFQVFRASGEDVALTDAGRVFVRACCTFLSIRELRTVSGVKRAARDNLKL